MIFIFEFCFLFRPAGTKTVLLPPAQNTVFSAWKEEIAIYIKFFHPGLIRPANRFLMSRALARDNKNCSRDDNRGKYGM